MKLLAFEATRTVGIATSLIARFIIDSNCISHLDARGIGRF
jgi:hypothetical protein